MRHVRRPTDSDDASTRSYTDEINDANVALFANHVVEAMIANSDDE